MSRRDDASLGARAPDIVHSQRGTARDTGDDLARSRLAHVRVRSLGATRGAYARVEVVVAIPAVSVLGMGAGTWHYTAVETRRIDDYRSR